jgi:sugar phosphate isomerase/epimerase
MDAESQAMDPTGALRKGLGLNRRQFLAAATGVVGAAALGAVGAAPKAQAVSGVTVPQGMRGIILFTVRDAISRLDGSVLDPATGAPLPGGFRAVFETLAEIGYHQIEFAGYSQGANGPITPAQIRQLLDDNGLVANGTHTSIPSTISPTTLAAFEQQLDTAETLGLKFIGTGGDPTGSPYKADWDAAAERWNTLGQIAAARGLKLYTHNHDAAYNFLLDSGPLDDLGRPTRSSGIRRLEYFFPLADPDFVFFEMDIFWAYVARFRWHTYTNPDGVLTEDLFDPIATAAAMPHRFPLFHVKDGKSNPNVTNGYDMVPAGTGDVPLQELLETIGQKGYHHPNYEQDNAPGGAANPGQSLLFSQISYENIASWRG